VNKEISGENATMVKTKKVTLKEVAKHANVSIASVSYVINGIDKVTDETKDKILNSIKELDYKPNLIARSLKRQESRIIALLIPINGTYKRTILTDNPFYQDFISGVEYCARESGYSTLIVGTDKEEECIDFIKGTAFSGVIVVGNISKNILSRLTDLSAPVVILDNENISDKFYYLNAEDEKGAYLATEYLLNQQHRKIGFLCGRIDTSIVHVNRFNGYKNALEATNVDFDQALVFESPITYEGGVEAAELISSNMDKMSAVFVASDIMALGLIKGLHRKGIKVPDDISIIGFDDIKFSKIFIPELTTIHQDIFAKGETAVQMILNSGKDKDAYVETMDVKLVERESVKPLK